MPKETEEDAIIMVIEIGKVDKWYQEEEEEGQEDMGEASLEKERG